MVAWAKLETEGAVMSIEFRSQSVHRRPGRKPKAEPKSIVRESLLDIGFTLVHKQFGDRVVVRGLYGKGNIRVLIETREQPYWTVQLLRRGEVQWFVDVPLNAGVEVLQSFILSVEVSNDGRKVSSDSAGNAAGAEDLLQDSQLPCAGPVATA